jgi:hypothetical protein
MLTDSIFSTTPKLTLNFVAKSPAQINRTCNCTQKSVGIFDLLCTMGNSCKIPMVVIVLEDETIHMLVKAEADGLDNHWWVVDTGASKSVVDRSVASFLVGDESAGSMATGLGKEMVETSFGLIGNFTLDGNRFDPLMVAIVDLHHINEEYAKYSDKRIAGLLGSDFFYREKAVIDYSAGCIFV